MRLTGWGILIGLAVLVGMLLGQASVEAHGATRCGPAVSTTAKAHHRAQRGWDSAQVKTRPEQIDRVRRQARCVPDGKPEAFVKGQIERARGQYRHRLQITPYDCGSHGYWAVPCYIIERESRYQWGAYNGSSGARGPYQFLGWPVPWPVTSEKDKMAHHRMAAKLWNGGAGCSHWSAC